MQKKLIAFSLLTLISGGSAAQIPSGGSQLQQIPPSPSLQKAEPEIGLEQKQVPAIPVADAAKIRVDSLHLTGQTLYSEAELLGRTGFLAGEELSLGELRTMAARIANFYHERGYFVAQAYLPPQEIKEGAVTIAIGEGRYGDINLRNQSTLSKQPATIAQVR